jgi:hypothetical protein
MPAPLTWRQDYLYQHTFDIWKVVVYGGEHPDDNEYELVEEGVRGLLVTKSSIDSVSDLALMEGDDMLTVDTLNMAEAQPIASSWIALNRSKLSDGSNHPQYGIGWVVRGAPLRVTGTATRPTGHSTVYAARMPKLPRQIQAAV